MNGTGLCKKIAAGGVEKSAPGSAAETNNFIWRNKNG